MARTTTSNTNENIRIGALENSFNTFNMESLGNSAVNNSSNTENGGSILVAIYNNTNARRENRVAPYNTEQLPHMENTRTQSLPSSQGRNNDNLSNRRHVAASCSVGTTPNGEASNSRLDISHQLSNEDNGKIFSSSSLNAIQFSNSLSPMNSISETRQNDSFGARLSNLRDWTRLYLFGRKHGTADISRVSRSS